MFKYRYVKIKFQDRLGDFYAYERSFFGFFRVYLDLSATDIVWWGMPPSCPVWLYEDSLDKVKKVVKNKLHAPKMLITDAETPLHKFLAGEE